jgi:hypothetical protein
MSRCVVSALALCVFAASADAYSIGNVLDWAMGSPGNEPSRLENLGKPEPHLLALDQLNRDTASFAQTRRYAGTEYMDPRKFC